MCVRVCVEEGGELNMDIKLGMERVGSWWRSDGGREEVFRELNPSTLFLQARKGFSTFLVLNLPLKIIISINNF